MKEGSPEVIDGGVAVDDDDGYDFDDTDDDVAIDDNSDNGRVDRYRLNMAE